MENNLVKKDELLGQELFNTIFKYFSPEGFKNDPIVFVITEEMIRNACRDNFNHEISGIQLNRVHYGLLGESDECYWHIFEAICIATQEALDKSIDWSGIDDVTTEETTPVVTNNLPQDSYF